MPILNIRALPQSDPTRIGLALKHTCHALAEVYGCRPEQVWATWEEIRPSWYFEGEKVVTTQPVNTHPPIAQLICFEGKTAEEIENILGVVSRTLGEHLGTGENIFVTYQEAKSGHVIAGNGIIRKKGSS